MITVSIGFSLFWNNHHSHNHRIWLQWSKSPQPTMIPCEQKWTRLQPGQRELEGLLENCSWWKNEEKNNQKSPAEETFSFSFPAFTLTLTLAATLGNMSKIIIIIIIIMRTLRTLIGDHHSERWSLEISDDKTCLAMLIQYSRIWELYKGVESNTLYYDTTKS